MIPLPVEVSYFPGCSLATTAKENNASLTAFLDHFNITLKEIPDWNCCGSSSTHSIDAGLALALAARNLFMAPPGKPVLVACPGCHLRLSHARHTMTEDADKRGRLEDHFNTAFDPEIRLLHFFELLAALEAHGRFVSLKGKLNGLKIAPYYGCMLAHPPGMNQGMKRTGNYHGLIERTMAALGASPVQWPYFARCCGTFLSVSRPRVAADMVNRIMTGAVQSGAECIVTACAMCHLNLEIRCARENRIPVFHFSELLSLARAGRASNRWFERHLIDPRPLMARRALLPE